MTDFMKAAGLILISVVLCMILSGQNKYFPVLIAISVCCIVSIAALQYIRPVLDFFSAAWAPLGAVRLISVSCLRIFVSVICSLWFRGRKHTRLPRHTGLRQQQRCRA